MQIPFNVCPVVEGSTLSAFLANCKKAEKISNIIELRADSIKGLKEEDVAVIRKAIKTQAIFTFRHAKEGGLFNGDSKKQKSILKSAFKAGFDYVDVAYGNSLLKELSAKERKKLLVSYHSFKDTPTLKALNVSLANIRKSSPAIIKMATMIKKEKDILTLADLLSERKGDEKFIVIGMGDKGKVTRIMFPMMGSYLTYVAIEESKIAPGLMTYKQMQSLYNTINS